MAKLKFAYPIEEVHGKLANGFGAAQRLAKNNEGKREPYSVRYGVITKAPSALQVETRANFAAIAALCAQHRNNITSRQQDQAGFKAQTTYKTFNAYLWNVCKAEYEESLEDDNA